MVAYKEMDSKNKDLMKRHPNLKYKINSERVLWELASLFVLVLIHSY